MGLFNRLGREVEQFKQSAQEAAGESTDYRCQVCDETFHTEYEECPECGAGEIATTSED